jgi:integrase
LTDQSTRFGYHDFDPFGRWYTARRVRLTGRPASQHTVRTKQVHLASSANILEVTDEHFLGNSLCRPEDLGFLLDRLNAKMTTGSMRAAVYALLDFSLYAVAQGWVSENMVLLNRSHVPPKNPDPAIVVYSEDELEAFVTAARGVDVRWWALMAFLVDTGRRIGEALNLHWVWLRQDAEVPYFEVPTTKNGEPQYIPLSRRLNAEVFTSENIEKMKTMPLQTGPKAHVADPFVQPFPWAYGGLNARFNRFCDRAGLPARGFHCIRHSVITHRLARGVPMQAVSRLAGHKSIQTTDRRYNHTNALTFARFVEKDLEGL